MSIAIDPQQITAAYQQRLADETHRAITTEVALRAAQGRIGELEARIIELTPVESEEVSE